MKITLSEALRAQHALREAAGLGAQEFSLKEFIGMISDEIETLRSQDKSNLEITSIISATGIDISEQQICELYAPTDKRAHLK